MNQQERIESERKEECRHGHINSNKNGVCGKCASESHVCQYSVIIAWKKDVRKEPHDYNVATKVMCPQCLNQKQVANPL